jgi:hypothetical protein
VREAAEGQARREANRVLAETYRGQRERRNSGDDMLAEIRRRFQMRTVEQVPCLYRYLAEWLQDSERGYRVAAELLSIEQHRLADNSLAPMGLRVVATSTA